MFDFLKKIFSSEENIKSNNELTPLLKKDNELKKLTTDFDKRIEETKSILLNKFNVKPSSKDIYWAILQDLYLENFGKDKVMMLNIEYQRGLIRLKENNPVDTISYFCNALVYLYSLYPILNDENIDKKSIPYKEKQRIFRKMYDLIDKEFISREKFFEAFNHTLPSDIIDINFNELLKMLYLKFDNVFLDEDFINDFNFKKIKSSDFLDYTLKFNKFIKYYQKIKDINKLKNVLNLYYKFGELHHYCWGNYGLSLGWTHDLVNYKIKKFNPKDYNYHGEKIKYLNPIEYHNKFIEEYNEISIEIEKSKFNEYKNVFPTYDKYLEFLNDKKYNRPFKMDFNKSVITKEYFDDEDYKLFDKYLLN